MRVVATAAVRAVMTGRSARVLRELGKRIACVARKLAVVTCVTAIYIAGAAAAAGQAVPGRGIGVIADPSISRGQVASNNPDPPAWHLRRAAAEPFAAPKAAESAPATSAGGLAQVTLSLVLVLAVVFAAAWVVRRLRNFGRLGAGAIEIVADVALGTKERAVLVQVGKQQLLLGVAPGRVSTLHVLAEPVQVGRPHPNPLPRGGGGDVGSGFSSPPPGPEGRADVSDSRDSTSRESGERGHMDVPAGRAAHGRGLPGQGGGGVRPDFKAILKRSLGL